MRKSNSDTDVGLALGFVESLTDDTQLQEVVTFTVNETPTTTLTGVDSGGSYSLSNTGNLNWTIGKTAIDQIGGSINSQEVGNLSLSLTAQGSDLSTAFSDDDYTISANLNDSTTLAQLQNDFSSYFGASGSTTVSTTWSVSGDDTTGNFTGTVTGSSTSSLTSIGNDGTGSVTSTTTASNSLSLATSGNYGTGLTFIAVQSGSSTVTSTGFSDADTYTETQSLTATASAVIESINYGIGVYTAIKTATDSYTLTESITNSGGSFTGTGNDSVSLRATTATGFTVSGSQTAFSSLVTTGNDETDNSAVTNTVSSSATLTITAVGATGYSVYNLSTNHSTVIESDNDSALYNSYSTSPTSTSTVHETGDLSSGNVTRSLVSTQVSTLTTGSSDTSENSHRSLHDGGDRHAQRPWVH